MKTLSTHTIALFALVAPLAAHPNHQDSVHNDDLRLEKAHTSPPAQSQVRITETPTHRIVESNGIPDHDTGRFPNRKNPNAITVQNYRFEMPLEPKPAAQPTPVGHNNFGVALNGVVFDPATAEYYNNDRGSGWNYEALGGARDLGLDDNHAHVQPTGAYHYHGLPTALFEKLSGGRKQMTLIGWAADGYPIYGLYGYKDANNPNSEVVMVKSSYRLKEGRREGDRGSTPRGRYDGSFVQDYEYVAGSGDLDECNGRFGPTPEFPDGTYHYILTQDYPFIPRLFRGTPDRSFAKGGPGRGGPGRGGPGGGPGGDRPPHPPGRPPHGGGRPPHPPRR